MTFNTDFRSIRSMERFLKDTNKRGIPFAIKDSLNATAFQASKMGRHEADRKMTMRNKYTERSIVYNQVRRSERNVDRMKSEAGSLQEYMRKQETGFTERSEGKHGVMVPTSFAANQMGAIPRTKLIRKPKQMHNIKLTKAKPPPGGLWHSKKQEIVRHAQEAVNTGRRFVFLTINNTLGIWKVVGGRKVKRGFPKGAKFKLLYDSSARVIDVKSREWLSPATAKAVTSMPETYRIQLNRQLDRLSDEYELDRDGHRGNMPFTGTKGQQFDLFK